MKPNNLKFAVFIIPFIFVLLYYFYKDTFYIFIGIISLLLCFLFFMSKKSLILSFKFPRLTFKKSLKNLKNRLPKINHLFSSGKKISTNKISPNLKFKKELINRTVFITLAIAVVLFTSITLFLLPANKNDASILMQYYMSFAFFAAKYLQIILIACIAILLSVGALIWKKYRSYKIKPLLKLLSVKTSIICITLIFGFHLAFVLSYLCAMAQVSYVVIGSNKGFVSGKIITDAKEINRKILSSNTLPHIVYYDYPYKKSLVLVKLYPGSMFYGKTLITQVPDFFYQKLNAPQSSIFLVGDNLLLTELKESILEELSPTLGKILIKNTFKDRNIKSDPKIALLNRQDYLKLREKQINDEVKKLDDEIATVDQEINVTYSYITDDKKQLQEAQDFLANSEAKKNSDYNTCKTAGENFEGQFYRYYTDDQCNSVIADWDNAVKEVSGQINEIRSALNNNQAVLAQDQNERGNLSQARDFVNATKEMTPDELGVFFPEKNIKIALDSNNPDVINGYLETLTHEYLHYTSYVSEDRTLDSFFEEALTEYFARKVVKQQLNYTENVGYPVAVKVIEEMAKKIPENKLLEIYFTKDQDQLEALLDETYGKNFYKDSTKFFFLINYLPLDDSLKAANTIMVRIDGKKITKESVF